MLGIFNYTLENKRETKWIKNNKKEARDFSKQAFCSAAGKLAEAANIDPKNPGPGSS